jgi:hypothetical protein
VRKSFSEERIETKNMKVTLVVLVVVSVIAVFTYLAVKIDAFGESLKSGRARYLLHSRDYNHGIFEGVVPAFVFFFGICFAIIHALFLDYPDKNQIQFNKNGEMVVCDRFYFFWEPECGNWYNSLPEMNGNSQAQSVVDKKAIFANINLSATSTDVYYSVEDRRSAKGSGFLQRIGNSVSYVFVEDNKEKLVTIFESSLTPLDDSTKLFNEWIQEQKYFNPTGIKGEVVYCNVVPLFREH